MNKYLLFFVIFFVSCGSGSDSDSGNRIGISWDATFDREYADPEDDASGSTEFLAADVLNASISSKNDKNLIVKFDLKTLPTDGDLGGDKCQYRVYFESDAYQLNDEDEIPVYLIAQVSNCGLNVGCFEGSANVSYGIYYEHESSGFTSLYNYTSDKNFVDYINEEGDVEFEILAGDFGKALSEVKQKDLQGNPDLGNLFKSNIRITDDNGIRMEASCNSIYDLVPNDGFSYE